MSWFNIKYFFTKEWWIYHSPIYINLSFCKLYKDWWKVRKKINGKPRLVFYKGDMGNNNWCEYYMDIHASYKSFTDKWFAIHVEPLGYKYKFGMFEYTYQPEVVCVFNKKIIFTIRLEAPNKTDRCSEHEYWEPIVNLITQKKD